jgi:hypothetical protein
MTRALLDGPVERRLLDGHDGRSGARIERVVLADGTSLILKAAAADADLTVVMTGGVQREKALWDSGALARLTGPVGHAILDVWTEDDVTFTLMRDLGDAVPGWTRVLSRAECNRILDAITVVHATFVDDLPPDLCPLSTRVGLLSPRMLEPLVGTHPLAEPITHGWECFAELTPPDLLAAVTRLHADPSPLVTAMQEGPITLVHADLWLVNLALEPQCVTILDWAIATAGPPALDLAVFLTGSAANVEPTREELIDEFRSRSPLTDARAVDLALLFGLCDMGWNKALDALEHEDPAHRERELADLHWWQERATEALVRHGV